MQKLLLLVIAFTILFSCNNQRKQENAVQGTTDTLGYEIPHIFHGWISSVALAKLNEDDSFKEWGKATPDTIKYALYLDNAQIAIFDDTTQLHYIEEYLGTQEEAGTMWYNIATIDHNGKLGYVRFNYQNDSTAQIHLDYYPKEMVVYPLISFMPQEELDERLSKYKKQ